MEIPIEDFAFSQMIELGSVLRDACKDAKSMEDVAGRIVRQLFDGLVSKETGQRAFALVRFFKTHPFGELSEELRQFTRTMLRNATEAPAIAQCGSN